jgi:hypothetical protein
VHRAIEQLFLKYRKIAVMCRLYAVIKKISSDNNNTLCTHRPKFSVAKDLVRIDKQRVMCNPMVGVINGALSEKHQHIELSHPSRR